MKGMCVCPVEGERPAEGGRSLLEGWRQPPANPGLWRAVAMKAGQARRCCAEGEARVVMFWPLFLLLSLSYVVIQLIGLSTAFLSLVNV